MQILNIIRAVEIEEGVFEVSNKSGMVLTITAAENVAPGKGRLMLKGFPVGPQLSLRNISQTSKKHDLVLISADDLTDLLNELPDQALSLMR